MASLEELLLPTSTRPRSMKVLLGQPHLWSGNAAAYSWKAYPMVTATASSRRRRKMPYIELGAGRGRRRRRALGVLRRVRLRVLAIVRVLRRVQRRVGYYFSVPAAMPGAVAYIR